MSSSSSRQSHSSASSSGNGGGAAFSIDAAALQSEMAKKYRVSNKMPIMGLSRPHQPANTTGSGVGSRRSQPPPQQAAVASTFYPNANAGLAPPLPQSSSSSNHNNKSGGETKEVYCPSCSYCHVVNANEVAALEYCQHCGYFLPKTHSTTRTLSLAQRRGLLPVTTPSMTKEIIIKPLEWYVLEGHIARKADPDYCCPICMDNFLTHDEVLLSCGHLFHTICLRSFENFMKNTDLTCPLCRSKHYQKKMTNLGSLSYQRYCAMKIQALARGFLARQQYKLKLRRFYKSGKGNEIQRKRYFEQEFTNVTKKMDASLDNRTNQVNSLLQSMDRTLDTNRQLDFLFEQMLASRMQPSNNTSIVENTITATTSNANVRSPVKANPVTQGNKLMCIPCYDEFEFCNESKTSWKGKHLLGFIVEFQTVLKSFP